jgi:hypothetical protein
LTAESEITKDSILARKLTHGELWFDYLELSDALPVLVEMGICYLICYEGIERSQKSNQEEIILRLGYNSKVLVDWGGDIEENVERYYVSLEWFIENRNRLDPNRTAQAYVSQMTAFRIAIST